MTRLLTTMAAAATELRAAEGVDDVGRVLEQELQRLSDEVPELAG